MSLKLMEPVYNEMPFFQANQVLTVEHLNDLAGYLAQQERYTRNKLIGSGIVCGLSFKWEALAASKARVTIDDGTAITSAGYHIVYKQPVLGLNYKRIFNRLGNYPQFNDPALATTDTIYELITQTDFDNEKVVFKDFLFDVDKNNMVLILLLEPEIKSPAKCLDENCDDKGKVYLYTIRPLLVPVALMDKIINANNSKPYFTEEGRGAKGRSSILSGLDQVWLGNLFTNNSFQGINTVANLVALFKAPCQTTALNTIKTQIDNLVALFPWIFSTQLECMKTEVVALAGKTVGTLLRDNAQAFRNNVANDNYMQYLYDFLRDVADAYNELFGAVSDLLGECGGNEYMHPHHVMLGKPLTNDTLACYNEDKYNEDNFKYRHYFVPSPVMDTQFMLYEKTQSLFKRLVRIIANFNVDITDTIVKITPAKDYDSPIGERPLPYFYKKAEAERLKKVWNYEQTRRNKISRIKGYQLTFTQDQLLDEDTSKNNFYRVEGHIGSLLTAAKPAIDLLRNKYNLPFTVTSVSIQQTSNTITCAFPDLEEEYSYYRDRVLGYLREIRRWLDSIDIAKVKNAPLKVFLNNLREIIATMLELLGSRKCIEQFDYNRYKKMYNRIWELVFDLYFQLFSTNISKASQSLNSVLNILNIIFFRPIYKIWYMYKYRMALLSQTQITSLKLLAQKTTGLEHLAGVRRGETFLLVTDSAQGDKVVADFNLPDLMSCSCDCKPESCSGNNKSLVSPLQKPVIMVVDYSFTKAKGYGKAKAYYDASTKEYVLELDSMGFYKADSTIGPDVKITNDNGQIPTALVAKWLGEKLVFRYKTSDNPENDGAYKFNYELVGDFDEQRVQGLLFLFIIGRVRGNTPGAAPVNVQAGGKATPHYPYDKGLMKRVKPEIRFDGASRKRIIGDQKVEVYTTAKGNEIGIYKDRSGMSYIKVISAKSPGVEEVPYMLQTEGVATRETMSINVVDKADKIETDTVTGIIQNENGQPAKDVKISAGGGKEVITNDKGEYVLKGVRAGDVMTIEMQGYKTEMVQVNSKLDPNVKLQKESSLKIDGLDELKIPGEIGSIISGFGIDKLKNFMK